MPVTSGMLAGASTASPCVAEVAVEVSQSAAPESPEAAVMVCPCTVGLLRLLLQGLYKAGQVGFAISIAGADDRRQIIVDGKLQSIEDVLGTSSRRCTHTEWSHSWRRHRTIPRRDWLRLRPRTKSGAVINRNQQKVGRRQSGGAAEGVDVSEIDLGLSHHRDLLSGSIQSGGVRVDVVDRGKVSRGQEVVSGLVRGEVRLG